MVEYQNINANESGLSVRAKLNNMFKALISSNEGVNKLWQSIMELTTKTGEVQKDSDDKYQELKEQLLKSFDYIDKTADDLLVYINGINGGVSGFAVDPTFKPEFPTDVAATVLAAGAGTYVNFLDSNGQAITITESNAITIFYKAKGVTFWQYKSIYALVTTDASKVMYNNETSGLEAGNVQEAIDEVEDNIGNKFDKTSVTQESGDSEELVMSQKAVTYELNILDSNKFDKNKVAQDSGDSEEFVMSQKAISDKLSNLSSTITKFVNMTEAAYEALETKEADTYYMLTEE